MTIITDQSDIIYSICETDYNSYVSTGYTYTYGVGNMDIWLLNIGNINNQPPNKPAITGETQGNAGESYDYTFVSTDPDCNNVYYYIDWGDDQYEEWIGPYESGEAITHSHIWEERDTYTLRCRAKDTLGGVSEWGTMEVSMPVNQHPFYSLFLRFLERFPNAFPILRQLLGL